MVAERLVYAMTKMGVPNKVVRSFISYIVDVESLEPVYANYLYRYPDFTDAHNDVLKHVSSQSAVQPPAETAEDPTPKQPE